MPLTAGGKLTIVASADLGGLGAREGAPITYDLILPSITPFLLPWLAILGLLAMKVNRTRAAWLIWLPLGCVMAITRVPSMLPSGPDFLLDVIAALAIGLAAVWLLSTYLRRSHRLLTSFCVLPALAGFGALTVASWEGWSSDILAVGIIFCAGALASAIALSVGGWVCRDRFRPMGLCLWMLVSLLLLWLLMAAPFFIIAEIVEHWRIQWSEFFIPVLSIAVGNFAILLPFLILSSASPFYRERLRTLLHVQSSAPPVMSAPAPGVILKN